MKANTTGDLGVVICEPFEQAADGYRPTVGVIFDDGSSGAIRVSVLTIVSGKSSDWSAIARAIEQGGQTMLSGLARQYECSSFVSVPAWLLSFDRGSS